MGEEAALRWYAREGDLPEAADPGEVEYYVALADVTRRLGAVNERFHERLREQSARFGAAEYLGFDPRKEAPAADLPARCGSCGEVSGRGAVRCACGAGLVWRSCYDVWSGAMVTTYTGDSAGMPMGASYRDVLRWLPGMRPYRGYEGGGNAEFRDIAFAVTHLVYTLNDYNLRQLAPEWLPEEFAFLQENARAVQAAGDHELLGEFVDSLRAFGVPETGERLWPGIEYLLDSQNADGSWGQDADILRKCHTTWTAVDGLREFAWGEAGTMPAVLRGL